MNAQAVSMEFLPHLPNQSLLYHGQYTIQYVLGYGQSSWSYLALDNNLDILVVIKEFYPHGHCQRITGSGKIAYYDPEKRELYRHSSERFAEDARRLAMYNKYPGSASICNLFQENGTYYLAMEYQPGCKLNDWLANRAERPGWIEAVGEMIPVLEALQAMHTNGITRGDLNPGVFFKCEDSRLMLLEQSQVQPPGLFPGYAAFEQHTSPAAVGPLADVHGAAAVLFWILTGIVLPSALERAAYDGVPSLVSKNGAIPEAGREIMLRALAFKMRERCPSCQEFQAGLQCSLLELERAAGRARSGHRKENGEPDLENEPVDMDLNENGAGSAEPVSGSAREDNWLESSESYTGRTAFGVKHGHGSQAYANGDRYTGEWVLGRRHGKGIYYYSNGDRYEGQWRWDRKHGLGSMTYANGDVYSGEWKEDLRNGRGKEILARNERYTGQWKDGKRSGQGTEVLSNGDSYTGEWLYGLRNGSGTETFINGDQYAGQWRADRRNGQGLEIMSNGDRYEGEFRDGRRHGYGILKMSNGDEYEGEWRMGKRRVNEPVFNQEQDQEFHDAFWKRRQLAH